jgi:hypothetical protein
VLGAARSSILVVPLRAAISAFSKLRHLLERHE